MKKIFVLITMSLFALVGCGSEEKKAILSFDETEIVANEDGSFEVSGYSESGSLVKFNDSTVNLQPDSDGNFKTLITIDNPVDTIQVVATKAGEDDVATELSIDNEAYNQATPSEISIEFDSEEVETDENGEAIITGKTFRGAKVTIGMGILGDSVTADDDGNFELAYTLNGTSEANVTINATVKDVTASADVKVKPSSEMIQAEKEGKDITILSDEPTDDQRYILMDLAQQQFDQEYPYKGSKMHTVVGVIQDWTQLDGSWYYKVEATIVNGFGAEATYNLEVHIEPTGEQSGIVTLLAY